MSAGALTTYSGPARSVDDRVGHLLDVRVAQLRIGVGIDVDVVRLQPGDRAVDQLAGVGRGGRHQRQQERDHQGDAHHVTAPSSSSARSRPRSSSSLACRRPWIIGAIIRAENDVVSPPIAHVTCDPAPPEPSATR